MNKYEFILFCEGNEDGSSVIPNSYNRPLSGYGAYMFYTEFCILIIMFMGISK